MNTPEIARMGADYDREVVVDAARSVVDRLRTDILGGEAEQAESGLSIEGVASQVVAYLLASFSPSLGYAINATGTILHTGLGRALLSSCAGKAVQDAIRGYCTLAVDLDSGQRADRDSRLSALLRQLTGAEASTVVNNNAAATMLILNSLAEGKEVIVSRGQLVEIGGSFRMPDVMKASGVILREVGTTNKTHLRDYRSAINENTGAILHVHQSNYRLVGFTAEPSIQELAEVALEHNLPLVDDIGSGALIDLSLFGLEAEPMVQDSISNGADVVCFSGDKLIGGPQSGIIVGKAALIQRIRKNPLARALRIGKMTVSALEATLRLFLDREKLCEQHPTYRMLSLSTESLEQRALATARKLDIGGMRGTDVRVVDGGSLVGSGSVPAQTLPTKLLSVKPGSVSAEALAQGLRHRTPPIFARIHQDAVLFDFRTIQPNEDDLIARTIGELLHDGDHRT
jgi:L-seryl-tRNA(Ser) seleniumtransferase